MIDFADLISISRACHQYRSRMIPGIFDAARRIQTPTLVPLRPQTKTPRPDTTRLAHLLAHRAYH